MGGGQSSNRGARPSAPEWRDIQEPRPTAVVADQGVTIAGSSINGRQGGALNNATLKFLVNPRQSSSSAQLLRYAGDNNAFGRMTKLFIRPSLPFQFRFQGRDIHAPWAALYHPCPVRIENVQYDAVLAFNDPGMDGGRDCIMVPLRSRMRSDRGEFVSRIAQHVPSMLNSREEEKDGKKVRVFDPVNIAVGSGWDVSQLFTTGPSDQQETEILDAYFTWNAGEWEQYLKSQDNRSRIRTWGWRQTGGRNYILLKEPVDISPSDMSFITSLPTTDATTAIHPIGQFSYKPGRVAERPGCKATATDKSPGEMLSEQETRRKEQASQVMYAVNSVFLLVGLVVLIWAGIKLAKWIGPGVQAGAGWLAGQFSKRVADAAAPATTTDNVSLEDIVPDTSNPMREPSYKPPSAESGLNDRLAKSLQQYKAKPRERGTGELARLMKDATAPTSPTLPSITAPVAPPPIPSQDRPNVDRPITAEEVANAAGTGLLPLPAEPPVPPSRPPPIRAVRKRKIVPTPPSSPRADPDLPDEITL